MSASEAIVILTREELHHVVESAIREALGIKAEMDEKKSERKYVYGLDGIAQLFNVSRVTAQQYKNTFLAPAVSQRGRHIATDVELALELFDENRGAKTAKRS